MNREPIAFGNETHDLEFRISAVGYEFPETTTGDTANWLIIRVELQYGSQRFQAEAPSLVTGEVRFLVEWFETISTNKIPRQVTLHFTEPNLEFQLYASTGDEIRFGIKLSHEFKPPFRIEELAIDDVADEEDEFVMVFEYTFEAMRIFGQRFRSLYEAFPQRGDLWG